MVTPRLRTSRTVPRQAIVALFQPSPRWPEVSTALALDVLAVMGSANGFNLALGCTTATDADAIAPKMPAGVELHVALADAVMPAAV